MSFYKLKWPESMKKHLVMQKTPQYISPDTLTQKVSIISKYTSRQEFKKMSLFL